MSAAPRALFSPAVVAAALVAGMLSFLAFLWLTAYAPEMGGGRNGGAHALSNGATGFRALGDLLDGTGGRAVRARTAREYPQGGLLVLTPTEDTDPALLARIVETSQTVAATRSRKAKVVALADTLRDADAEDLPTVVAYLGGSLLQRRTGVGWRGIGSPPEPADEPTATTTLRPPDGVDVVATRARLLAEHGIVVSALGRERAPGEMAGPVLRVSPHLDVAVEDLEALAEAL